MGGAGLARDGSGRVWLCEGSWHHLNLVLGSHSRHRGVLVALGQRVLGLLGREVLILHLC